MQVSSLEAVEEGKGPGGPDTPLVRACEGRGALERTF